MTHDARQALFAVSSLGLGHATRTLVVIREYLRRGYAVTIVSAGNAMAFLRLELGAEPAVKFREMTDYPSLERGTGWRMYWYLFIDLLRTWRLIRWEHHELQAIAADYDFIFSDGRYGFYSRWTPSFILSHQIAFIPPKGLRETSWLTENVNIAALQKFDLLFIPDYYGPSLNLAGHLAHTPALHQCPHRYIGILSSYGHLDLPRDIDYLFVISGYLLEHKDSFVHDLLEQASSLPGRKVFVLGDAGGDAVAYNRYRRDDLQIHSVASGALRQELFNRARVIVSRAGYTTVMDLVEHGKRALLIPTPNQTEQEYLAAYLSNQHYFVTRTQQAGMDLARALHACEETRRFDAPWKTEESLRRLTGSVEELLHRHFFSIIVPAHNEEAELEATLQCLLAQRYPPDRVEIIVVENGSSDATLDIAKRVAEQDEAKRVRVLQSERGVSRAKNAGLANLAAGSEWVVFCDADTRLGKHFLHHLNSWLNRRGEDGLIVGTTHVRPESRDRLYARAWFAAYNVIHRLTNSSFSIQVARTLIARDIRFREDLNFAEDLLFIQECRRYGRFFFVPTDQVCTSTRRFDTRGYLRQGLRWMIEALLPLRLRPIASTMSFVDLASLEHVTAILAERNEVAYAVLFLGAFFETLIPTSLVVLGEVFFIAGALLAGMGALNVWAVLAVLYAGAILGDNASYWLGRHYGSSLFEHLAGWPVLGRLIHHENYQHGVAFFEHRGAIAVFSARLSGPLSWVMPAMAGMFRLNYATFIRFNTLGILIGIGQFIVVGYFFGEYLPSILEWADRCGTTILASLLVLIAAGAWYRWRRRAQPLP